MSCSSGVCVEGSPPCLLQKRTGSGGARKLEKVLPGWTWTCYQAPWFSGPM